MAGPGKVTPFIRAQQRAGVVENLSGLTPNAWDERRFLGTVRGEGEEDSVESLLLDLQAEMGGIGDQLGSGCVGAEWGSGALGHVPDLSVKLQGSGTILSSEYILTLATSTAAYGLHFFPEHFTREFSLLHRAIFHFLDNDQLLRCGMAAPRGYGKTTIINVAHAARVATFGLVKFGLLVACTATQGENQLRNLKIELETNDNIKEVFGEVKGPIWTADSIMLSNGTFIMSRGAGQQLRGLKHRQYRPDLIICDDLEDPKSVQNEDLRKELKSWFYTDLMRCGKGTGQQCKIIFIGTILHQDSLLENILQDPGWTTVRLEAFDDNLVPVDPGFLDQAAVNALYSEYQRNGLLDQLYREYRNIATAPENRVFPTTYHRYFPGDEVYEMVRKGIKNRTILTCVIVDPAKTANAMSDFSALIGVGFDLSAGVIYIHRARHIRVMPDKLIEMAFDLCDEMNTNKLFIETTGLNEWLLTVVRTMMLQRVHGGSKKIYDVEELKANNRAKEDRIARLAPLYRVGMIMHNGSETTELEAQLMQFPRSKFDDLSDAVAYVIPVLAGTGGWDYQDVDQLFEAHQWGKQLEFDPDNIEPLEDLGTDQTEYLLL